MPTPTPMPTLQRVFGPRIQGLICKSCRSKILSPRNQIPPWLSRSIANDKNPPETKMPKVKKGSHNQPETASESVIRVWDETPDGLRVERVREPGDDALLQTLESTIEDVRAEMATEAGINDIDEDELEDRVLGRHFQDIVHGEGRVNDLTEEMESHMNKIDTEVNKRLEQMDTTNLSDEERFKLRNELFELILKSKDKQPDHHSLSTSVSTYPEPSLPEQDFPSNIQQQLRVLIDVLRSATALLDQGRLNRPASIEIWKAYEMCRENFVSSSDQVSDEVWEALWNIFMQKRTLNYGYLRLLGQDMKNAAVTMQSWQRLVHIQAMFAEGDCDAAIEQWEECKTSLGENGDASKDYWEVGHRLYTQSGQLGKAIEAAESFIKFTKNPSDFRTFKRIMQAFLHSNERGRKQKAWALYVKLKFGLGSQMEVKDYDDVASIFFGADLPDLALGVFRDMMLIQDASVKHHESTTLHESSAGIDRNLDVLKIAEKELAWDDPRVLAKLPAKFNNKFFFGKWLKKLIGDGEFDASIKVFNLMHERGIRPDARYVNGLIGAWLRTGKAKNHQLAEDTAWRMIEERLVYVENRETRAVFSRPLRPVAMANKANYKPVSRHPPATIETFSVLIEDYRRRQKHDRMKDLMKALEQARIRPNTFFMNQLMMVDSQYPRNHAWDTYTSLTRTQGVHPDFDTFGILWHHTKKVVDPNLNPAQFSKVVDDVPNNALPRVVVAEMVKWMHSLTRRERLPRELYDLIILSFSLSQDHPGTAITLRVLRRHFNMFPNEDTIRTIILQLARGGLKNDELHARRRRLGVSKSPVVKDRIIQVTKLLGEFKAERVTELLQRGIVFEELSADERLEESLVLMTELLQHVSRVRMEEGQGVGELFETAARAMGVLDCIPL